MTKQEPASRKPGSPTKPSDKDLADEKGGSCSSESQEIDIAAAIQSMLEASSARIAEALHTRQQQLMDTVVKADGVLATRAKKK